ncbi:hypothetical protein OSB04_009715 [Centaurea solstitialis]|uniref:Uncharacterized protein n=1 Tax=Centaurea solstitialis TaxID=347529 RepID=A0AA38TH09_9ASTR|nr:hypothetical protein OSB04_009715 [Centaurea solstitialis]
MGQLAILHPQPLMRSPPTIKFIMNPPSQQTPNFTTTAAADDSRRRTQPPKGILKKNNNNRSNTEKAVTESKKLVMGQVKILKRGELLNTVLKEVNDRKLSTDAETTKPEKRNPNRKASKVVIAVLPSKKETENSRPKLEESKDDNDVLCSTSRLGPDPEVVSKQMKKVVSDCFAGSAFSDSPPPSSVPLPGFFRKNLDKDDATTNLRRILGLSLV